MITKEAIQTNLRNKDLDLIVFETLESSNSIAANMALDHNKPFAVLTREQTAGRGTHGRSYYCPKDKGLYLTMVFYPTSSIGDLGLVTPAVGLCVAHALHRNAGVDAKIKWVNDIVINDKKICGILCESRLNANGKLDYLLIGIGLNLYVDDFLPDIVQTATSLHLHGSDFNENRIAADILDGLCDVIPSLECNKSILEDYRALSSVLGREIIFDNGGLVVSGKAIDINRQGNLVIEVSSRRYILTAGDVSIKLGSKT